MLGFSSPLPRLVPSTFKTGLVPIFAERIVSLGFDVNTQSTGYAVVGAPMIPHAQVSPLACGRIDTNDCLGDPISIALRIQERMQVVKEEVDKSQDSPTWIVGVEDYLRMFSQGKFHTTGLCNLAALNTLVQYNSLLLFGTRAHVIHPTRSRHHFGFGKTSKSGIKRDVYSSVREALEPLYDFRGTSNSPHESDFDVSDAYLVANYALALEWEKIALSDTENVEAFVEAYFEKHKVRIEKLIAKSGTLKRRNQVHQKQRENAIGAYLKNLSKTVCS